MIERYCYSRSVPNVIYSHPKLLLRLLNEDLHVCLHILYHHHSKKKIKKSLNKKPILNKVIHQIKWCAGAKDIYGLSFIMTLM